jgi:hypothetical protein
LSDYREKAVSLVDDLEEMNECHLRIYQEIVKNNPRRSRDGAEEAAE